MTSDAIVPTDPDGRSWSDLDRPVPAWFEESKLGFFIHWGPYSVPAWAEPIGPLGTIDGPSWFRHNPYAEWYANTIRIDGSPAAERHARLHGGAPYGDFLDAWTADDFDPEDWIDLFRRAGADFVVPVTKHHDGFPLWDAPGSSGLTTIDRGPRRDVIGELASSTRRAGLRFGAYYSGGLDWSASPDLPPIRDHEEVHTVRPLDEAYHRYADRHVRDLVDRYRPEMIWNDIDWPDAGKHLADGGLFDLFAYYRSVVPDGVVNDRWGVPHHDFRTSEYEADAAHETGAWQHTRGLGFSFAHNTREGSDTLLDASGLARLWVDVVARGGQLLINVGPDARGCIPALQRSAIEGFGAWRAGLGTLPSGVRAWQRPQDAGAADEADGLRFWNAEEAVVVFSPTPGERDVEVPGVGRRRLRFDPVGGGAPSWVTVPRAAAGGGREGS